jgi:hypothetical protein
VRAAANVASHAAARPGGDPGGIQPTGLARSACSAAPVGVLSSAVQGVVTIIQCRRVVMPYFFVRYCLPRMRAVFPGRLDVVLIQHEARDQRWGRRLRSMHLGRERQELVKRWTADGRYGDAEVIRHAKWHAPYPSIPSFQLCAQVALAHNADFHLWLEDDALVDDAQCGQWERLIGNAEVGVYRPNTHIINNSWFVSRPSFDARVLPRLSQYWTWRRFSRLEAWFRKQHQGEPAKFEPRYAVRNHHKQSPFTGMPYVVDKIAELAPHELDLLEVDFGDEARRCIAEYRAKLAAAASAGVPNAPVGGQVGAPISTPIGLVSR